MIDARVRYVYRQSPELYEVLARSCEKCPAVSALTGSAIKGTSDGKTPRLSWPDITLTATLKTRLTRECAPGPRKALCESDRKAGTTYAGTDDEFLGRAAGQEINLGTDRTQPFYIENRKGSTLFTIRHTYKVSRIK